MITEIHFPEEMTAPLGLQPATLRDLKSLVVLAGPNGAGKSRYLELVAQLSDAASSAHTERKGFEKHIEMFSTEPDRYHDTIKTFRSRIDKLQPQLQRIKQARETDFKTIPLTYNINIEYNSRKIGDGNYGGNPFKDSPDAVDEMVASNTTGGFDRALKSVYSYFFDVARALHEAEHPRSREVAEVAQAQEDARAFNKVLRALLDVEIEPALNEKRRIIARIRDRPFDPDELSKGELVLAVWAILLHRQKEWLQGACILIDPQSRETAGAGMIVGIDINPRYLEVARSRHPSFRRNRQSPP